MNFKDTQAIYIQIADLICDHILTGKWEGGERIPSVREMGVGLQVNPNTVMRAYEYLQTKEIIYNKRGIGFFVSEEALPKIREEQKRVFMEEEWPEIFRKMILLGIPLDTFAKRFEQYRSKLRE